MLYPAALGTLFLAEPLLVANPLDTLAKGAVILAALLLARGLLRKSDFFSTLLATLISVLLTPVIYGLLVLFGAPVAAHFPETILLALHVSLLSIQPLIVEYGLDSAAWRKAVSLQLPRDDSYGGFLGTFLGAWLGAIPIALDWDRPWQAWPITIVIGAYAGCLVGTLYGTLRSLSSEEVRTRKALKQSKQTKKTVKKA